MKGDPFLNHIDTLYAITKPLLTRYRHADQCGVNNCNLLSELHDNPIFESTAESLHDAAAAASFDGVAPTIDYCMLEDVDIKFGIRLAVTFRICFFTESLGNSDSPARFSLSRISSSDHSFLAEYGCGLLDDQGHFWYPRTVKHLGRFDMPPDTNDGWAFFRSKRYGGKGLSSRDQRSTHDGG